MNPSTDTLYLEHGFDLFTDGVLLVERTGQIVLANHTITTIIGARDKANVIGRNIATLLLPERQHSLVCLQPTEQAVVPFTCSMVLLRCLDGSVKPVEVRVAEMILAEQSLLQYIIRDLSHQPETVTSSYQHGYHYHALFVPSSDGMVLLDDQQIIRMVNRPILDLLGRCENEVVGRSVLDFLDSYQEDVACSADGQWIHANGTRLPVQLRSNSVVLNGKTVTQLIVRDMREQQQIESQLQQTYRAAEDRAARFRLLVEMGHDLMSAGGLEQLLHLALERAIDFSGYDSGSILLLRNDEGPLEVCVSIGPGSVPVGTQVDDLTRSISGRVLKQRLPLVLEGHGETIGTAWRTYTRAIPSTIVLPLMTREGTSLGVLALGNTEDQVELGNDDLDALQLFAAQLAVMIERLRLHDENLHLVQQLGERERRLRDLVEKLIVSQEEERRRIAHELHDGLAQVAASAYQHLETFAHLYSPAEQYVNRKLEQALNLAQQVVKEARRTIAGLRPAVLDDFGLTHALRMEVEMLRSEGWSITYEETMQINRLPAALETAFFRVTQEALMNIRKHAGPTSVRLTLICTPEQVRLEVQDRGAGFDMHAQPQQKGDGHHIGLLSMQERMAILDGSFLISSQPGQGTLIVAEAPIPRANMPIMNQEMASVVPYPSSSGRSRLIIADDHDLSRAGIRNMLQDEPTLELIGEATNGREALTLCQQLTPDLVLLDVRMPEMDGLQTTRAIKQTVPQTSVIMVTMHEDSDYLLAAMRAGASGYLLKDSSRRELLSAIRNVLRGESFLNTELTRRMLQQVARDDVGIATEPVDSILTPREHEVLQLLVQGQTNRQIASQLSISALTVKVHVKHIMEKLGASDRTQAAVRAVEMGLLEV
ncbi:MAG: response regulator [Chloroflexaceae bacterium]|nr:response regulator [Chloroflexaceae bacterium]